MFHTNEDILYTVFEQGGYILCRTFCTDTSRLGFLIWEDLPIFAALYD